MNCWYPMDSYVYWLFSSCLLLLLILCRRLCHLPIAFKHTHCMLKTHCILCCLLVFFSHCVTLLTYRFYISEMLQLAYTHEFIIHHPHSMSR